MKLNLLKKLLCLSPLVISPVLVSACGNSGNPNQNDESHFYVNYYKTKLEATFQSVAKQMLVISPTVAKKVINLKQELFDKAIAACKKDGKAAFNQKFTNPTTAYDATKFDSITNNLSLSSNAQGFAQLNSQSLNIFHFSPLLASKQDVSLMDNIKSGSISEKTSLALNFTASFVTYNNASDPEWQNNVQAVAASDDGNTVYVGTFDKGVTVGTKQSDGSLVFKRTTVGNEQINCITASADGTSFIAGSQSGKLFVGTKSGDTYNVSSSSIGGAGNPIYSLVYANYTSKIWYLASKDGFYVVKPTSKSNPAPIATKISNYTGTLINKISVSDNGRAFAIATLQGLYAGSTTDYTSFSFNKLTGANAPSSSSPVDTLAMDTDGTIYASATNKIYIATKSNQTYSFTNSQINGMSSLDSIKSMAFSHSSNQIKVVLAGEDGVVYFASKSGSNPLNFATILDKNGYETSYLNPAGNCLFIGANNTDSKGGLYYTYANWIN